MKLTDITSPASLRGLNETEMRAMAQEIRDAIVRTVAQNGGHLSSNLGVVELTLALHRAFDCPRDKIVFDVGHQCYAHKIVTGRYKDFHTLRQLDGLSGFPRREESPCDAFGAGHASTAISAALGLARARDLMGESYRVAAVVGDGAMGGGMCYEALNDAGNKETQLLLVLNDNGMSISRNVGALSRQLTRLRVSRGWLGAKRQVSDALRHVPLAGEKLQQAFLRIKNHVRNVLVKDKFFTSLGFRYFGPIDGHDLEGMERVFRRLRDMNEPVVVHVVTKKGSGFTQAEEKPEKYHGVAPFVTDGGKVRGAAETSLGQHACRHIMDVAEKDRRICVIVAAMADGTGFKPFANQYPDRFFDVGIAEEHAVTLAAGMAAGGMRPFVAIYETFLQRGYDQIVEDVCQQKLPVCFLMDRAGLGGEDGPTHHGLLGVSMLRCIPHLKVLAPRNENELWDMIDWTLSQDGPVAIRYPRGIGKIDAPYRGFSAGKWETLRKGESAALIASSGILSECMDAAERLDKSGLRAAVVNASTLRPLDEKYLEELCRENTPFLTVEEHVLSGGLGSAVAELCALRRWRGPDGMLALPEEFIPHGSRCALLRRYGLDGEGIAERVLKAVGK